MANWRLWSMLAWNDIHQRYRRSVLGPFWITISMGIFVVMLGVIYGKLFRQELAIFLPYLAMKLIAWGSYRAPRRKPAASSSRMPVSSGRFACLTRFMRCA
jgi:ABC-type polysaccharide/polyol phosphate export permease